MSEGPIITGRLRMKDETGQTLSTMRSRIGGVFADIGKIAAGFLMRDVVQGFIQTTKESTALYAKAETLKEAFNRLVISTGEMGLTLMSLREATQGTIGDMGILTAANNALALGLPVDRLNDLFKAAMVVGHAMGRTTLEAVNDLATGIGRQSRLILDNLGIIVDVDRANEAYAKTVGKQAAALSDAERKTAFMNAAMTKLEERAALLSGTTSEAQKIQEQFGAAMENLKIQLGEVFLPVLISVTEGFMSLASTAGMVIDAIMKGDWERLKEIFKSVFGKVGDIAAEGLNKIGEIDWKAVFSSLGAFMAEFWGWAFGNAEDPQGAFLRWLGKINWGAVFSSLVGFLDNLTHTFYDVLASMQEGIANLIINTYWGIVRSAASAIAELARMWRDFLETYGQGFGGGGGGVRGGAGGEGFGGGGGLVGLGDVGGGGTVNDIDITVHTGDLNSDADLDSLTDKLIDKLTDSLTRGGGGSTVRR